jgi:hypothetical protein
MIGRDWRIQFLERLRARGIPVGETFPTRQDAERKREDLQANLTDIQKVQRAHFSLVPLSLSVSFSKAIFKQKERGLRAKSRKR